MAKNVQQSEVDRILERYAEAKTRKSVTDNDRREAGKYVWPAAQEQIRTAISKEQQPRTVDKYDDTAVQAAYRMTSGIFTYLMPAGTHWHGFKAQKYELNQQPEYLKWMSIAANQTHEELLRSNFQREMFLMIRSMIVFGTGVISVEMIDGEIVFKCHHIGSMFFDDNNKGRIDTIYRQIFYTVRQAEQEFGKENLSRTVRKLFDKGKLTERHEYVHVCAPNKDFDRTKVGSKPVGSLHICIDDKEIVRRDSGFKHLPYLVARFACTPGGIMGYGPAIEYIEDIRMLNRMARSYIESAEIANNPPMMCEDDGVVGQPVTGPHGMIYVRSGAQFPQPYVSGINVQSNFQVIEQQRQIVKMAFFNDLFEPMGEHRNMTAEEVRARVNELIVIVTPAVISLANEVFSPMLTRVLDLLMKSDKDNRIPEPPDTFDYDVVYQGRLALAMSNVQANAQVMVLSLFQPYQEVTPVLENVDMDKAFRHSWISAGAPAENLTDYDAMIEARRERKDMEDLAAQAEIAESGSKAYRNVSNAPEEGSLAGVL